MNGGEKFVCLNGYERSGREGGCGEGSWEFTER